jgi:hypothetical protein
VSDDKKNLFDDLDGGLPSIEGRFTMGLIALLRRHERLREAFLAWVAGATGLELDPQKNWIVSGEQWIVTDNALGKGGGFVDMVLRSDDFELWCEHKIDAVLGPKQLEKYLDGARRRRMGIEHSRPLSSAGPRTPTASAPTRIGLVVISKRLQDLVRCNVDREAFNATGCGFCWAGDNGYLAWQEFLPRARDALRDLEGFERDFAGEFLRWWESITGMVQIAVPEAWAELFPARADKKFERSALQGLWQPEIDAAREMGWRLDALPYAGNDHTYSVSFVPGLRQVLVKALRSPDRSPACINGMRAECLEVSFVGPAVPRLENADGSVGSRRWSLTTEMESRRREHRVRVLVEVGDWASVRDDSLRACLLLDAWLVGVQAFESKSGLSLSMPPPG